MSQKARSFWAVVLAAVMLTSGCKPVQPFYLGENPDMAHYVDVATKLEYPDVNVPSLTETRLSEAPFSLDNPEPRELWDLRLEEAIQISLTNSKVLKTLGGLSLSNTGLSQMLGGGLNAGGVPQTLRQFAQTPDAVPTIYGPALQETNAVSPATQGVESALAEFDAQFTTSLFWDRVDQPQNADVNPIFPAVQREDRMVYLAELSKRSATGGQFFFRNNTTYTESNSPFRALPSDWLTNFEVEARQPLMRGAGTQVNRVPVVLARIRTDISLAAFECDVRNHVRDVEGAYWELYFAYRNLEAQKQRRDILHAIWRFVETTTRAGLGTTQSEALARQEYLEARASVEAGLGDLFKAENRLRYLMGLAATDGRLIRPVDEPINARVKFDWHEILCEGLARNCELRIKHWQIKQRETELITARNQLLPRMDAVALYRWLGRGDDLINDGDNPAFPAPGSDAMEELFHGNFQEWRLGVEFALPIGFRRELAGMRHTQLQLARERALLQETELELVHQLSDSVSTTQNIYQLLETTFNRKRATSEEVDAYLALIKGEIGRTGARGISENLEFLLNAIRRDAAAQTSFYRLLVNYSLSITDVHLFKGSLLEYNNVRLAEGPWPEKAYFDAHQQARKRAAGHYLNYGFTRPRVISRGEIEQFQHSPHLQGQRAEDAANGAGERIPTPPPSAAPAVPNEVPAPNAQTSYRQAVRPVSHTEAAPPVVSKPPKTPSPANIWDDFPTPPEVEPLSPPTRLHGKQAAATASPPADVVDRPPILAASQRPPPVVIDSELLRANVGASVMSERPRLLSREFQTPHETPSARPFPSARVVAATQRVEVAPPAPAPPAQPSPSAVVVVNGGPLQSLFIPPWVALVLTFIAILAWSGVYIVARRRSDADAEDDE